MDQMDLPFTVITLPEPSSALTVWRADFRRKWGAETLEVGEDQFSFFRVERHLRAGRFVAALIDRPQTHHKVAFPFPNGSVYFSAGPVLLALVAGCPMIPATVVRLPSGGYRLEVFPPIYPVWLTAGRNETIEAYTRQLARAFIPTLCNHPDQWYHFVPVSV
jgi:lauroyl/myristoyl acyltransferase